MLSDEDIYIGNKFKGKNNNLIFEIKDIYKGNDGYTWVRVKEKEKNKTYEILKSHFKHLLLIPLSEREASEDVD